MTEELHVNDSGVIIRINVQDAGVDLDADLEDFTTRTVWLRRPRTGEIVVITSVTVEADPLDDVMKLKLVTGTSTSLSLTGTGGFKLPAASYGMWVAEVFLGDSGWSGATDSFELFYLLPLLT